MTDLRVNSHVTTLNRFLPFNAGFDQLFEEHVQTHVVDLPAKVLRSVVTLTADPVRLVVLTGDAGHGKTFICRRLVRETAGGEEAAEAAYEAIRTREDGSTQADGSTDLGLLPNGHQLRIVRDLSETDEETAASRLADALMSEGRTTVVCANEGRLRVAIARRPHELGMLREAVDRALTAGTVRNDDVAILDLNRQAVAAEPAGLIDVLIRTWAADGNRWRACAACDAERVCPIRENRRLLGEDEAGPARRATLAGLIRLVELGGTTVTVRELLAVTALAVTGGLGCKDVHGKLRQNRWQARHLFFESVFGVERPQSEVDLLRALRRLSLLDPGHVSLRAVDDELIARADRPDTDPFEPIDRAELGRPAHSTNQARALAARERRYVEYLRRRAIFEVGGDLGRVAERCGLRFANDFLIAARGQSSPSELVSIRDQLLVGLEAVQGIRRRALDGVFVVADPAFRAAGAALVIARKIEVLDIDVKSLRRSWSENPDRSVGQVAELVDWLDRKVILDIQPEQGDPGQISLDLLEFEFLMRSAEGLADGGFFDATSRRMRAVLARLAEGGRSGRRIEVVVDGDLRALTIDVDGRIIATAGPQ